MTSLSSRFRVTLPAADVAVLDWLAVESGNDRPTEAALLLRSGIRLALRRYKQLYSEGGAPPPEMAGFEALLRGIGGKPGEALYPAVPSMRENTQVYDDFQGVVADGLKAIDDRLTDPRARPPWGAEEVESDG